jgi:hypothetical protein
MISALARSSNGSTELIPSRLFLVTPPSIEPITLADVKTHLRVNLDDDNSLISDLTVSARSLCESDPSADGMSGGTGRQLNKATYDLKLDGFPWGYSSALVGGYSVQQHGYERQYLGGSGMRPIVIPKPPLVSVTSIQYVDPDGVTQTWSNTLYTVDTPTGDYAEPGRIFPVYGQVYPVTRSQPAAVTIRLVAGYGETAAAVPSMIRSAMKLLIGIWYENREAGLIVRGSSDVLPFGVDALLQPFRVM